MFVRTLVLIATIAVFAASQSASGEDANGVKPPLETAAVVAYLESLASFSADFRQVRYDENDLEIEVAQGHCWIARPGRFRWEYAAPYAQSIISDGQQLWIHDVELEQVTRNQVSDAVSDSPAALLGQDIRVLEHFDVRVLPKPDASASWFELVPRREHRDFLAIELGFDGAEVRSMRLRDSLGQTTELSFSRIERDKDIEMDRFTFEIPVGVDLIEGGMP